MLGIDYDRFHMPVDIRFDLAGQQAFKLCCGTQSLAINPDELSALVTEVNRDYFGDTHPRPANWTPPLITLTTIGRRLYQWLDGSEGWLRTGLTHPGEILWLDLSPALSVRDLNPATESLIRSLAHLPWELLHDGKQFLAELGTQPIRLLGAADHAAHQPANRPLRLLFMASSPENVSPVLAYEHEESRILEATARQPIDLLVEESGSIGQLKNLVASFPESHFDVFHYTGHGKMDGLTPKLIAEDDIGNAAYVTAADLADAFGHRWPRAVFLSACHTAQAPDGGAVQSLAHALIEAGAPTVLGWARPVRDDTGILAATELYRALAVGETLPQAVSAARRRMLEEFHKGGDYPACPDWHLLRLYQSSKRASALVTPLKSPNRQRIKPRQPETDFLDASGNVKVAAASSFFGRRREIQRCLKALDDPSDHSGVFLHGLGGYGKSTIAARLCRRQEARDRNTGRVVLVGVVNEFHLRQKLSDRFGTIPAAIEALNQPKTEFRHQLVSFLDTIENQDLNLLLVFDDFEQNIPPAHIADGNFRLTPEAHSILAAVCFALEETAGRSRLIVTCRYHKADTLPQNRLYVEGLSRMKEIDIRKKTGDGPADPRILKAADGNPRLLERLLTLPPQILENDFLDALSRALAEHRENLLIEKLLGTLTAPERRLLARMTLFELPVPTEMLDEFRDGADPTRTLDLGLLEKSKVDDQDFYRVSYILTAPLESTLTEAEWDTARHRAAKKLYELWWDGQGECREIRALEICRLALAAREQELAIPVALSIDSTWYNRSRFQDDRGLCQTVLKTFRDYRILGTIAQTELVLGDVAAAREHLTEALASCPQADDRERARSLHLLGALEAQEGNADKALSLLQQSLEIKERIGNTRGKAATLHELANALADQGDLDKALALWQQSLTIEDSSDNVRGKAATLANIAWAAAKGGDTARAEKLSREAVQGLASAHAYLDLISALKNLSGYVRERRDAYAAQAAWLALYIEASAESAFGALTLLFRLIPPADPLEPLLTTSALYLVRTRGANHPKRTELDEAANRMLSIAAQNAGINSQEAFDAWGTRNRLDDPSYFLPETITRLETLIGDTWLFDPAPIRAKSQTRQPGDAPQNE